jgi:phytoene synthase
VRVPNPQSLIPNPELNSLVRRVDEDRWLASRFAPADVRARLIALYAVNHEIARTAEVVTQPALGALRLAWWREALAEIAAGKPPRAHPALQAYASAAPDMPSALRYWELVLDARACDLEAAPFSVWADLEAYIDNTAGNVMRMALTVCGDDQTPAELVRVAARAWGYMGLVRSAPGWGARGRSALPREGGSIESMVERAHAAHQSARNLGPLSAVAFPAMGYVALIPGYLRALRHGRIERPLLQRQLRLIAASATGRV